MDECSNTDALPRGVDSLLDDASVRLEIAARGAFELYRDLTEGNSPHAARADALTRHLDQLIQTLRARRSSKNPGDVDDDRCPHCGEPMEGNYRDADGGCVHVPL